jgi:iron-sulfur cluster assembly protein
MSTVSISATTSHSMSAPAPAANKDPLAGMTLLTAEGQTPRA